MNKAVFNELIISHYDSWKDKRVFKGLLNDYFPADEDRRYRYLVNLCVDEGIISELQADVTSTTRCIKWLCDASGCPKKTAGEVVRLWAGALKLASEYNEILTSPNAYIDYLDRSIARFKRWCSRRDVLDYLRESIDVGIEDVMSGMYTDMIQPHGESIIRYCAPVEMLFDYGMHLESYKALKEHSLDMIREVCRYSKHELKDLIGKRNCLEVEKALSATGFFLNSCDSDYISMYPEYIRKESTGTMKDWAIYLLFDVIIINLEWLRCCYSYRIQDNYLDGKLYKGYIERYEETLNKDYIHGMLTNLVNRLYNICNQNLVDGSRLRAIMGIDGSMQTPEEIIMVASSLNPLIKLIISLKNAICEMDSDYSTFFESFADDVLKSITDYKKKIIYTRTHLTEILSDPDSIMDSFDDCYPYGQYPINMLVKAITTLVNQTMTWADSDWDESLVNDIMG